MEIERLRELVRLSGKTQQEIADEGGLSLATVKKLLNGTTQNPGVDTLQRVLEPIGKSLSDLDPDFDALKTASGDQAIRVLEKLLAENRKRTEELEVDRKRKDIQLTLLSMIVILLMGVISGIFIIDSRNPTMGLIRPETSHLITVACLVMFLFVSVTVYLIYVRFKDWSKYKGK